MKLIKNNQEAYMGWHDGHPIWDDRIVAERPTTPFYVESRGEAVDINIKKGSSSAPTIPVEYSFDKTTWQSLGSTSTTALTINVPAGRKVWLRANTNGWASDMSNYNYITTSSPCNIGGNIMSLLYGSNFTGQREFPSTSTSYALGFLFRSNGSVVNASKLLLPAETLVDYCYSGMFYNCTSLTAVPSLPATTLAGGCYYSMFMDCSSLTTAPELPSTTLAGGCYGYMFYGCTGLTEAPVLPATTLASNCYSNMFYNCRSLTQAPVLPATTLAENCYYGMFYNCRSLTQAPVLPATTLAQGCYTDMFRYCSSLTQAPVLPATTLAQSCYYGMFRDCTRLTTAPTLPITTLAQDCYSYMFYGCTRLTHAPELPAVTLANYCYQYMFYGCTSLTTAPILPATTLVDYCYQTMFYGCTKLNHIRCLATDISAIDCTKGWVGDVAYTGTFTKKAGVSYLSGASGIPYGWTVVEE